LQKYIHYGCPQYDQNQFVDISNKEYFNKPNGGLWASPVYARYGWKQWCDDEQFRECDEKNAFIFELDTEAKILYINSKDDVLKLPKIEYPMMRCNVYPDFEKIKESGIDAIQYNLSDDNGSSFDNSLYFALYGWDCDSILVLNKNVIILKE
jgi:hypothetical protein